MTRMDKNGIYDELCKVLTDYETMQPYDTAEAMYWTLVKIQNNWEELTAPDNE